MALATQPSATHPTAPPATTQAAPTSHWHWLGPLLFMALIAAAFLVRSQGRWAENDSAAFTQLIQAFVREGQLAPASGDIYFNGYAYQALSAFILAFTGLDAVTLQQLVYPLLATLVVLPAWLLYRELTGSARAATLASLLLYTQPEFLFVMLRSSHEKVTRLLLFLCFFLLLRSFKLRDRPWQLAVCVGLFYLTTFAMIASNNLLANSFIFAVAVALALGWLLARRGAAPTATAATAATGVPQQIHAHVLQRLTYVTLVCLGLVYLFTFYVYPDAERNLLVLQSIWDHIAALFLDVHTQAPASAYVQVDAGWVSRPVYFLVSAANWIILGASFAIWARQGLRWLLKRQAPATPEAWLLWLFYAAFAAQGALSVLADFSGALAQNLQHRAFSSFSIIAVAVVAAALAQWRPRRAARPMRLALAGGMACLAVLSVFKATNEPLLSNKWTFYHTSEITALDWTDAHLRSAEIWTEFDERLVVAFATLHDTSTYQNRFNGFTLRPGTRAVLVTDVTRLRGLRLERVVPIPPDALRVYDNGAAQLYHLRPETPYQR